MREKEKLRVLRISHSATLSSYRDRERTLAAMDEIELALIYPEKWEHLGGGADDDNRSELFLAQKAKTLGTGSIPLFAFDPLPIIRVLKEFRPHVMDVHEEPYSVSCFESLLLLKRFRPGAACVFYSAQNINKRYPPPFRWSERFVYNNCQAAYPCSISVRDVLLAKGFQKPSPVIPLGVNIVEFSAHAQALNIAESDCFVVGYTGRVEACKGIGYLLHAIAWLQKAMTEQEFSKIVLAVAGSGSSEAEFKTLASELGIAQNVKWLGPLPAAKMPNFYRSCNTIVVPSMSTPTWREQFGRVPVEAMACGIPVISSNSGSLPEVVADAGIIVPEQDSEALGKALKLLINSEAEQKRLSAIGLKHVLAHYTWKEVANAMHGLYLKATKRMQPEYARATINVQSPRPIGD